MWMAEEDVRLVVYDSADRQGYGLATLYSVHGLSVTETLEPWPGRCGPVSQHLILQQRTSKFNQSEMEWWLFLS